MFGSLGVANALVTCDISNLQSVCRDVTLLEVEEELHCFLFYFFISSNANYALVGFPLYTTLVISSPPFLLFFSHFILLYLLQPAYHVPEYAFILYFLFFF